MIDAGNEPGKMHIWIDVERKNHPVFELHARGTVDLPQL